MGLTPEEVRAIPHDVRAYVQGSKNQLPIRAIEALCDEWEALRADVVCVNCGHYRSAHEDGDSPCFGGRTPDMKPGEGAYCDCFGFMNAGDIDAPTSEDRT